MKFLAFTDLHYTDDNSHEVRYRPKSLSKIKKAISEHSDGCDFIINLGDTADEVISAKEQKVLWQEIVDAMKESGKDYYLLIGNHDTSTSKHDWVKITGMPSRYYSFFCGGYKIIVLDANNNDAGIPFPQNEIKWSECYLDTEQIKWIEKELEEADRDILVFSHEMFLMGDIENRDDHVIINRKEVIELFEKSGKVKAVFCGHYHDGDFSERNGIQYITFRAICTGDEENHAVVTVEKDFIRVDGYGTQPCIEIRI
ncbi:MAG: metallophosphoesterase [Clostridia bacterium]|nr:metallophosphoesterase [Clostridia bacterium]